jgi:type II secretory pathway component GspD/PulD (secretin)
VPAAFLLWFAHFAVFAQTGPVEVITLKYRTAEQVMPLLRPMLDKNGSMTGMQNQLIVRTSPGNLNDLKKILAVVDGMPRRLLITVRQDAGIERERTAAQVSGRIITGNGSVSAGGDGALRARIDNTRSLSDERAMQSIQVLEGNSAFINVGQSVPVPQTQVTRTVVNGQVVERSSIGSEYRDVKTGFTVLPRLNGDLVILEINPQRETFAAPEQNLPAGSINSQRAATTVSGRLGEWIELGGDTQHAGNQQSVILGSTRETSADNRRLLVKVEEIR